MNNECPALGCRIHSMKRLWERFGLGPKEYDAIRRKVLLRMRKQPLRLWRVETSVTHKRMKIRIVFDLQHKEIVTVTRPVGYIRRGQSNGQ